MQPHIDGLPCRLDDICYFVDGLQSWRRCKYACRRATLIINLPCQAMRQVVIESKQGSWSQPSEADFLARRGNCSPVSFGARLFEGIEDIWEMEPHNAPLVHPGRDESGSTP